MNSKTYWQKFTLIGYSQGGLVARWLFNFCKGVSDKVKRLVTIGTPNLGIYHINLLFPSTVNESKENNDPNTKELVHETNFF